MRSVQVVMSTDQFDAEQVVRIRMRVEGEVLAVWSEKLPRKIAEVDVALGAEHLAVEHGDGRRVTSVLIIPWSFD